MMNKMVLLIVIGLLGVGFVSASAIKEFEAWEITKTGSEVYMDVDYKIINSTATMFYITFNDKNEWMSDAIVNSKDITNVPITEVKDKKSLSQLEMPSKLDFSKVQKEYSFIVSYDKIKKGLSFEIGWESIRVSSQEGSLRSLGENIIKTSNGWLHYGSQSSGLDIGYSNSSDGGNTWADAELYTGSFTKGAILSDSLDNIFIYYIDSSPDDVIFTNSSDNGATWSPEFTAFTSGTIIEVSCAVDSTDLIHCCFTDSTGKLYYGNSSNGWNNEVIVNDDSSDDTDTCDIEVTDNDCVYVIGTGSDLDNIEIWSPCLNGWGAANEVEVWTGRVIPIGNYGPKIGVYENDIYIVAEQNNDLLYCNSSDGGWTWNTSILDTEQTMQPTIAPNENGDLYILYTDGSLTNGELFMANSSDSGRTWQVRTSLEASTNHRYINIRQTNFPTTNHMTNLLEYIWEDSTNGDHLYDNFSISYTAPPPPFDSYCNNAYNTTIGGDFNISSRVVCTNEAFTVSGDIIFDETDGYLILNDNSQITTDNIYWTTDFSERLFINGWITTQ